MEIKIMEIKPCACKSIVFRFVDRESYFYIVCGLCGDVSSLENSKDDAIQAWNEGERLNPKMKIYI
jgi:hypothetical protein